MEVKPKRDLPYLLMAFIWPFIYLIRYIVPDTAYSLKIGVDVIYFHYPKVYLFDALSRGHFPLWSNAEAAGFPFFSSPFNQVFYPLNYPLSWLYQLLGGFSWADYQRLSVFGVALFAMFLFKWLRYLRIPPKAALFSTMIVSVSFKMLTTLNRVPATHSSAWLMLMLLALTMMVHQHKRWKGAALLFLGALMLLTGAYPYYIYYTIFLLTPFVVMLLLPKTREAFTGVKELNVVNYVATAFFAVLPPLLLCLPYIYKVGQLQAQVINRDATDLNYSIEAPFGFHDTLSALFIPCYSDTRGWYYFGFVALFLIVLYAINHFYRISKDAPNKTILYYVLAFFAFISLTTYANFFVFKAFWNFLPGFSSLRTWGRLNIVLLPFIALILAKSYRFFENILLNEDYRIENFKERIGKFIGIFTATYVGILGVQLYLTKVETYLPNWEKKLMNVPEYASSFAANLYIYAGIAAFFMVSSTLLMRWQSDFFQKNKRLLYAILPIFFIAWNSYDVGLTAIKIRSYAKTPQSFRKIVDVERINELYFNSKRAYNLFLSRIYTPHPLSVLHGKKWYYKRYTDFIVEQGGTHGDDFGNDDLRNKIKDAEDRPESLDRFLGVIDGEKLYFTKNNTYLETENFMNDADTHKVESSFDYEVKEYNGDYLKIVVMTQATGYLNFIDNWDAEWEAKVDGQSVDIEKIFGTFKSIHLQPGTHQIQFFYNPFPFKIFRQFPAWDTPQSLKKDEEKAAQLQKLNDVSNKLHPNKKVVWKDKLGIRIKQDSIIALRDGWGKSGVASNNILQANTNGAIEFQISDALNQGIVGLSTENKNAHMESINYGFHMTTKGYLTIYEKGRYKASFGKFTTNDLLKIERIDNKIYFRKNNKLLYSSDILSETDLIIDISFLKKQAFFKDIRSTF